MKKRNNVYAHHSLKSVEFIFDSITKFSLSAIVINPFRIKMLCRIFIGIIFLEEIDESPGNPVSHGFGPCSFLI